MEKFKIYCWQNIRNKFGNSSKGIGILKKELCKKEGKNMYEYELEHRIPVELGGHLFDTNNIYLIKKAEHKRKTNIDILIINFFKKTEIVAGGGSQLSSFMPLEELHNLYKKLFDIISESKSKKILWMDIYDNKEKPYEQVILNTNREVKDGIG